MNSGHVLLSTEGELYVQSLQTFDIKDIGSRKWRQQHEYLEKLNMQAVLSASQNEDEFVKEFLITFNKIPVLIHELIATELWKGKVFPEFIEQNIEQDLLFPIYVVLYHEATLINLLETTLYHSDACESAEDSILDLVDYVYRKMTFLVSGQAQSELDADDISGSPDITNIAASSLEDLEKMDRKLRFEISIKAVSIMRYITDHLASLPLSAASRILTTHDVPLLLVQFLESNPATRETSGKLMKYVDCRWQAVDQADKFKLTKLEGQVWIALFQLLLSDTGRNKYELNSYRKNVILKIRSYLTEVLLDQLPILCELQRYLEQLAIMDPPAIKSDLMIEQVPVIWEGMMKKYSGKWSKLADEQSKTHFNMSTSDWRESAKMLADTYNLDVLESLITEPPKCAICGEPAAKRCSRCQNEWYCRRECQVKHWPKHKNVCDMMVESLKNVAECSTTGISS